MLKTGSLCPAMSTWQGALALAHRLCCGQGGGLVFQHLVVALFNALHFNGHYWLGRRLDSPP